MAARTRASRSNRSSRSASVVKAAGRFHGHFAAESWVKRSVDLAHSSGAEEPDDSERADSSATGKGHEGSLPSACHRSRSLADDGSLTV